MTTPKLRFKEFDGEWTLQSLGSLFTKRRDKGISGIPTYSVTLNNGLVNRGDLERDTPTNLSPQEHLLVMKNDLAYNMMRMWQGALGLAPTDGIVSPAYVVLKPSEEKTNSSFFEYYFKRNRQVHNFWAYSQGLTEDRLRLYFDDFKVIKINAPSKEEQTKIASFLSAVDEKITQLTQKHQLLSQYKQGMMQKLFSQQIRFKADDGSEFGEWEENQLLDLSTKKSSKVTAKDIEDNDGDYIVFGASGHFRNINSYTESESYIAIVKDGAGAGRLFLMPEKSSVLGTLEIVKPNLNTQLNFLFYRMQLIDFSSYIKGSTIPHVYFKDYSQEKIYLPCLEEQTKIANFLSAIDQKIEVVAQQIEQAKQWKKGLLQQMFV